MRTPDHQSEEKHTDESQKRDATKEPTKERKRSGNDPCREEDGDTAHKKCEEGKKSMPRSHVSRKDSDTERAESKDGQ